MLPSLARAMTLTEYAIPLMAFQSSLLSTNVYQSSGVGNDSYSVCLTPSPQLVYFTITNHRTLQSKNDSYGVRHKARPNTETPLTVT